MPARYTQKIEDEYWSYADRVRSEANRRIENMDEEASSEQWKRELEQIGHEQTCSVRFFLMAYLESHGTDCEDGYYQFVFKSKIYRFRHVTAEYAFSLPTAERDKYIKLFSMIAADNHSKKVNTWKPLMWRAMLRNKTTKLLTRQEGFQLAHGLHLNLEQAEQLLMTALGNDGLCFIRSEDLIEAFCFSYSPANNYYVAEHLKREYQSRSASMPKSNASLRPELYTAMLGRDLLSQLKRWNADANHDTIDLFLDWVVQQSPMLDCPSRTATTLYRRLAAYAHELTLCPEKADKESNLEEAILSRCEDNGYDIPASQDVYVLANDLLCRASEQFYNFRNRKPDATWRYLDVGENGMVKAHAIGHRIPALLSGEVAVSKADFLFLLWYTCDKFWIADTTDIEAEERYERITNFWYLAEELLREALLPPFYVPHLLERSFLYAICANQSLQESPFEVYEGFCERTLPEKRSRIRESIVNHKQTKLARAEMEKQVEEAYSSGLLSWKGLEELLFTHLMNHAKIGGQYTFTPKGIIYSPSPIVVVAYPNHTMGELFDQQQGAYTDATASFERFQLVYGLSLYLTEYAEAQGIHCDFRINYRKNVTLTLLQWETFPLF